MTDLENRLTEALRNGADGAPSTIGLADAARRRARVRRRHAWEAAGVASVLVVGLPVGGLALRGDHRPPAKPPAASTTSITPQPADAGSRWESWEGVSVQVPEAWGDGSLTDWCADGGAVGQPQVERPEDPSRSIDCTPTETYGLRFSTARTPGLNWPVAEQSNDGYPPHTFVGTRDVAGVFVEVGTASAALSQQILDSVVVNARVAPDGCPATVDADDGSLQARQELVSLCGYDSLGMLSHSELLDAADSASATAAVAAAPPLAQCNVPDDDPVILLLSSRMDAEVDLKASCLFQRGDVYARTLTDGVGTWAVRVQPGQQLRQ